MLKNLRVLNIQRALDGGWGRLLLSNGPLQIQKQKDPSQWEDVGERRVSAAADGKTFPIAGFERETQ